MPVSIWPLRVDPMTITMRASKVHRFLSSQDVKTVRRMFVLFVTFEIAGIGRGIIALITGVLDFGVLRLDVRLEMGQLRRQVVALVARIAFALVPRLLVLLQVGLGG